LLVNDPSTVDRKSAKESGSNKNSWCENSEHGKKLNNAYQKIARKNDNTAI